MAFWEMKASEYKYIGIIMTAIAILNSFLIKVSLNPSNKNGISGNEYLIKSLCVTNKRGVKNTSAK